MSSEPHATHQRLHRAHPGVVHLLSAAVDATPHVITCAELRDADDVVVTLHRPGTPTTRLDHPLEIGALTLVLEGEVTTAELEGFAEVLVDPVRSMIAGAASTEGPVPGPDHDDAVLDVAELVDLEHRVRTRVTVARGWVELLRTRGVSPRPDLDPLAIASRQLAEIEEVLRVGLARARTTSEFETRPAPLDLVSAVEDTLADSAWSLAPHVTGPVITGDPRPVDLDAVDLRDALLHLLDNATRHTPPDTPVEVCVSYRAGWVELAVEDAGPGLPPVDDRSSGVGTRVVQRLAAAMGAHLEFDRSVRLGGAAIRLLWPHGQAT